MAEKTFDPDNYKQAVKDEWQKAAPGWHKWMPLISKLSAKDTDLMLDTAGLAPGMKVLDIAAGDGDQSLQAARRVGPDGYVLATDLSSNLLEYARASAEAEGMANLETRVMDGEKLELEDGSFDAVICRQGLMLMPNVDKALREIYRVLRTGGRASAVVFSTPDKTPWLAIPAQVAMKKAQLRMPEPGMPGLFSLGPPGVFEAALQRAGFTEVEAHYDTAALKMESAAECVQMVKDIAGAIHTLMQSLSEAEKAAAWRESEQALGVFEGEHGFSAPKETIIAGGVKP